ncbi:MAG: hypothetical protein II422_04840, partial [Prevotella sp.]|nr:hypothetical protein [Prevotella sp.]
MTGVEVGAICAVMGILCGIVAIVTGVIAEVKRNNNEREIRRQIIESKLDPETAKVLITPVVPKEKDPYGPLQGGCVLLGMFMGYLFAYFLEIGGIGFWITIVGGMG